MENNNSSIFNFSFDEDSKSNLSSIAQWANINSIVGLAGIVISVLSTVITLFRLAGYSQSGSALAGSFLSLFIGLVVSLVLNITLIYAAINIKKGLVLTNQPHLVTGLTKLATYFKIFGILMIIVIVIAVLAILIGVLVGGFSRGF
jgi:uncharacterized membrane protein